MESIDVEVGGWVYFTDATGSVHNACVTAVWGHRSKTIRDNEHDEQAKKAPQYAESYEKAKAAPYVPPSLNVVYVSKDSAQTDSYGRQIARATSVPHESVQPAHGMKWRALS